MNGVCAWGSAADVLALGDAYQLKYQGQACMLSEGVLMKRDGAEAEHAVACMHACAQVLYSSKPSAVGGPLRSAVGTAVFPGQDARQVLEAPNKLINLVGVVACLHYNSTLFAALFALSSRTASAWVMAPP